MQAGEAPVRPRRLTRSSNDRVIAGVAGGLGTHTGLDPIIFRIGFVALALTGGLGFLLYVLAALFIPREDGPSRGNGGLVLAVLAGILVLFGGAALLGSFMIGMPFIDGPAFAARHFMATLFEVFGSAVIIALALIAVGYIFLREDRRPGPPEAGAAAPKAGESGAAGPVPPAAGWTQAITAPRRSFSTLPWLTLAAILVALGTLAALDNTDAVEPRAAAYPAVALGVTGLGLLAAARWGRGKWLLVPLGLALLPMTIVASATDLPLSGRFGSFYAYPASPTDLAARYEILAGELYLDLSGLDDAGSDVSVDVRMVAGQLRVAVPRGMGVEVTGAIDAGAYENYLRAGGFRDGLNLVVDEGTPARPGFGTARIAFEQGVGKVEIMRVDGGMHDPHPGDERHHPRRAKPYERGIEKKAERRES